MRSVRNMKRSKKRVWAAALLALSILVTMALLVIGCGNELDRARALEDKGDLAGAIEVYSSFVEEHPDNLEALDGLAVDLMLYKDYDAALPVQERVVALDKQDVLTRIELGFNYLSHQNRPSDAVRVLGEAAALEPTGKYLSFLAQAQKSAGDRQGAEETLRRALDIDPTYAFAYQLLNALLLEDGRTEEVKELESLAEEHGVKLDNTP
jgi:tetratricopeptide (TPR) repeat protein